MFSSHRRRSVVVAVLVALGVFTIASQYQSASASSLSIAYFYCEDNAGNYGHYSVFSCDVDIRGGTGLYTYHWIGPLTHMSLATESTTGGVGGYVSGKCRINSGNEITLRVTDSAGAITSASSLMYCY